MHFLVMSNSAHFLHFLFRSNSSHFLHFFSAQIPLIPCIFYSTQIPLISSIIFYRFRSFRSNSARSGYLLHFFERNLSGLLDLGNIGKLRIYENLWTQLITYVLLLTLALDDSAAGTFYNSHNFTHEFNFLRSNLKETNSIARFSTMLYCN